MFASEFQLKIFYPNRGKDQPFSATLTEKTGSGIGFTLRPFTATSGQSIATPLYQGKVPDKCNPVCPYD